MNISTAVSAIGSAFGSVSKLAVAALPAFAPIIAQAINRPKTTGYGNYGAQPYGGPYPMANIPTTFMPGGPSLPQLGMGAGALMNMGMLSADPYGGLRSPFGSSNCITPVQTAARVMLPRTVHVPNPMNPNVIETYVKAPRVKYRVSVSRAGGHRRCSGGR